jgi:ribose/xylose/arabinose/galactoside ABC-type transport system permease subunit
MTGGKGEMWAVVLTTFFIGTLRYGLGLNNVPGQYMLVITGSLLIISIISNNIISEYKRRKQLSQM